MFTDRRRFLAQAGVFLWSSRAELAAEHHLISATPLITNVELNGVTQRYIPLEDFYIRNHREGPPEAILSLQIAGEVERPQQVTINELAAIKRIELGGVLECAGSLVGPICQACDGLWGGWWLRDVLALARPTRAGNYVCLYGRDGYSRSVPIARANQDGLLATHLNRVPLRREHGAGTRAVFFGWYGMDSVKWLDRIVLSREPLVPAKPYSYMEAWRSASGETELRPLPRLQPKSVILVPSVGSVIPRGAREIKGLAWSGSGKIAKVEVSGDDGESWTLAEISSRPPYEWNPWRGILALKRAGSTNLVCRATDESGLTQPANRDFNRLDLYVNNWYHRVRCVVI